MQRDDDVPVSPSFNSYSSDGLASIAAKVSDEFTDDKDRLWESFDDDEFEFSLVIGDEDLTADDAFSDGQISPVYPIFDRNLVTSHDQSDRIIRMYDNESIRIPLKKLFIEDREDRSSTSSESDELEPIPAGSYCVWGPEFADQSPSKWKKSGSTGSRPKKWRVRDLLRRCNSDGKGPFVFLTPKPKVEKTEVVKKVEDSRKTSSGDRVIRKVKTTAGGTSPARSSSPHEMFYVRNRAEKEGGKRKSYLPYRQDLVGLFTRVNGMGKYHAF